METKIQFQKNAVVLDAGRQQIGSLNRVVVNPSARVLTDIVIRTGTMFHPEERVVPIEFVAETTEDQIVLHEDAGDLDSFPPFEEEHIVDTQENTPSSSPAAVIQPVVFGAPVYGTPLQATAGEKYVTKIDQNIPEGTVAMKEGAKVISADGKHVGNVERVFSHVPDEQITHLLISRGKIKKKTKLIPINWVKNMGEETVDLRVRKVSVDDLADSPIIA